MPSPTFRDDLPVLLGIADEAVFVLGQELACAAMPRAAAMAAAVRTITPRPGCLKDCVERSRAACSNHVGRLEGAFAGISQFHLQCCMIDAEIMLQRVANL